MFHSFSLVSEKIFVNTKLIDNMYYIAHLNNEVKTMTKLSTSTGLIDSLTNTMFSFLTTLNFLRIAFQSTYK